MQTNLTSQAYNLILKKIILGEYKPGTKISEKQIEEDLKIGRTPVREALLRLRQEHLINVVPQSGTFISKIDLKTVADARFVRMSVEQRIMHDASMMNFTDLQKLELQNIIQKQEIANLQSNFQLFFKSDDTFHEFFYKSTNHLTVWDWLKQMNIQFDRFRFLSLNLEKSAWEHLIEEHKAILAAVINGQTSKVETLVSNHLHLAIEEKNELVKKFPDYFENADVNLK